MADTLPFLPVAASLDEAIRLVLAEGPVRIRSMQGPDGQRLWLKRAETLSLRLRLQKGDSTKGFEADRHGLHVLGDAGLPVAPILAEGPDFFVTPDLGTTLQTMLRDPDAPRAEMLAAFSSAGRALARLHEAGYSHGRPSIRDICWDGTEARFIDLERFSDRRRGVGSFSMDVLILVHSVFSVDRTASDVLDAAIAAYLAKAPAGIWGAVQSRASRLGWLGPLTAPLRALKPRSRDLNAIPLTLAYVAGRQG